MCLKAQFLYVLFICTIASINSARILGIVPTPSFSHQVAFRPLWKELSLRGHQLTVLTTDPMNDKSLTNLTEIDLHFSYGLWNRDVSDSINVTEQNFFKMYDIILTTLHNIIDLQLQHPKVQMLIKNKHIEFDLVIVEFLIPTMYAFAERFKCPYIGVTSLEAPTLAHLAVGNPAHPVLNPDVVLPFVGELNFFERVLSTLFYVLGIVYGNTYLFKMEQPTVNKYFGDDYPLLQDIHHNVSMLFVNSNPIFHSIRPLVPAVVQIGGGGERKLSKPLPKDLQKTLDDATDGFIYFSLGSNIKSKDLSEKTRSIIFETFAELPYKILWKYELEELPNKPSNVIVSKWFPQQDIFRHSNMKLFITQGGLQSMEEALYNSIPMVGIPFFVDQITNVKTMVTKGLGLSIDHKTMDKESFKRAILEVINNAKYRNRIQELSNLAKDQPMTGLERAVWWTEYVLRHKGAKHLRSPALDLPWYQYFLLDVIGFCLVLIFVVIYLFITTVRLLFSFLKYLVKPKVKTE